MTLKEFTGKYCQGKNYNSCINSPCLYASREGCLNPLHPKNSRRAATDQAGNSGPDTHGGADPLK